MHLALDGRGRGGRRVDEAARRRLLAALIVALASTALFASASPASAATLCTWGGTPLKATGSFTTNPGLKPLSLESEVSEFFATGPLAGPSPRCRGQMTWRGAAIQSLGSVTFKGDAEGLPGVARFSSVNTPGLVGPAAVPAQLHDAAGKRVGIENASLLAPGNLNLPFLRSAVTPEGLQGAKFSSVILLF